MQPTPAATVVVSRPSSSPGGGVEVLMLRRTPRNRFAPGFVVFPGGVVSGSDPELAGRWFGSADEAPRACAIRELAEEAGLALTRAGMVSAPGARPGGPDLPPPLASQLPEIARWIAPVFLPVRFDARFYAAAADRAVDAVPDGVEIDRAWWASPHEILEASREGVAPLMWPTLKMLEALTACRSVADVLAIRVEPVPPPFGDQARPAASPGAVVPRAYRP